MFYLNITILVIKIIIVIFGVVVGIIIVLLLHSVLPVDVFFIKVAPVVPPRLPMAYSFVSS